VSCGIRVCPGASSLVASLSFSRDLAIRGVGGVSKISFASLKLKKIKAKTKAKANVACAGFLHLKITDSQQT
jgi:hypothetical protein